MRALSWPWMTASRAACLRCSLRWMDSVWAKSLDLTLKVIGACEMAGESSHQVCILGRCICVWMLIYRRVRWGPDWKLVHLSEIIRSFLPSFFLFLFLV